MRSYCHLPLARATWLPVLPATRRRSRWHTPQWPTGYEVQSFARSARGASPAQRSQLARVPPELLLQGHEVETLGAFTETWQRHLFFEALARALLSATQPILLSIDDLQWCDPETIEWLHYVLRSNPNACLLIAATVRLEELGMTLWDASSLRTFLGKPHLRCNL